MSLFKERLQTLGMAILAITMVVAVACAAGGMIVLVVWILSLIHQNLPGILIFAAIGIYMTYQAFILMKWLIGEPVMLALKNRKKGA